MAKKRSPIERDKSDIGTIKYLLRMLYGRERDDLAWSLIRRFGGVGGIFGATYEELMTVDGMTERAATFFTFVRPAFRQILLRSDQLGKIDSTGKLVQYASVCFMNVNAPSEVCLSLDANGKIVRTQNVVDGLGFSREVIACACRNSADAIALLRYVPRGAAFVPNAERLREVMMLSDTLRSLGVELTDYLEYTPYKYFSLRNAIANGRNVGDITSADVVEITELPLE